MIQSQALHTNTNKFQFNETLWRSGENCRAHVVKVARWEQIEQTDPADKVQSIYSASSSTWLMQPMKSSRQPQGARNYFPTHHAPCVYIVLPSVVVNTFWWAIMCDAAREAKFSAPARAAAQYFTHAASSAVIDRGEYRG